MTSIAAYTQNKAATSYPRKRQTSPAATRSENGKLSGPPTDVPDYSVPLPAEGAEDSLGSLGNSKQPADFIWDEDDSQALRQARKDAELTISADAVRAYLRQILPGTTGRCTWR
jgi:hypothetical protein